jgi:hypothetical protein
VGRSAGQGNSRSPYMRAEAGRTHSCAPRLQVVSGPLGGPGGGHNPANTRATAVFSTPLLPGVIMRCSISFSTRERSHKRGIFTVLAGSRHRRVRVRWRYWGRQGLWAGVPGYAASTGECTGGWSGLLVLVGLYMRTLRGRRHQRVIAVTGD